LTVFGEGPSVKQMVSLFMVLGACTHVQCPQSSLCASHVCLCPCPCLGHRRRG